MTSSPLSPSAQRSLERWLAARLGALESAPVGHVDVSNLERPPAGQSNETVLFQAEWTDGSGEQRCADLVLRRQPTGNQLFHDPDVVREARVLMGLVGSAGVPVPGVVGTEADRSVLGAPFFVMDAVPGRVPLGKPSIHAVGWLPTLTVPERQRLWASAMDVLVAIHSVDWQASHAFLLDGDKSATGLRAHIERMARWYRWTTGGRGFPITDAALEHLVTHHGEVRHGEPVLVTAQGTRPPGDHPRGGRRGTW